MMPRALLPRGQKSFLPKRYSILTIALLDSHHGVTRCPRATREAPEPIAAWSEQVERLRNRAVHEVYEPTREEMNACVEAVDHLVTFLGDQVVGTHQEPRVHCTGTLGTAGF